MDKTKKSARLHYLDWLQVLAVVGVVLFHTIEPFDELCHIARLVRAAGPAF